MRYSHSFHSLEAEKGPMSFTFGHTHPGIVGTKSPPPPPPIMCPSQPCVGKPPSLLPSVSMAPLFYHWRTKLILNDHFPVPILNDHVSWRPVPLSPVLLPPGRSHLSRHTKHQRHCAHSRPSYTTFTRLRSENTLRGDVKIPAL